jgi:ABC-2 type transport system ATP-binding protein
VLGYLGPNGAGKTTTLCLLLDLARPTAGRAEIFGQDCARQSTATHRRLSFVSGEANLWPALTGSETLTLLGRVHGQVDSAYQTTLVDRFDFDPTKKVRSYSKGNCQKLSLIAALMVRPDLLLLDEPTNGLDPLMEQAFRTSIHEATARGQTVFLSSHSMSEVEALCDRVAILRDGALVELGTLAELRHLSATLVEVTFASTPPDLSRVPGVSVITKAAHLVRVHVQGPLAPLLALIATSDVTGLVSRPPSLEELFLAQYGRSTQTPEPGHAN